MPREYLSVDFGDLEHGLSVLFDASTENERKDIASRFLFDIRGLGSCTALDDFIRLLAPVAITGDAPSPSLRDSFNSLVIAYSGWSADRLIAKKQSEESSAHGKKGGRGKQIGTVSITSRNAGIIREFNVARAHSSSDTDAAQRMIDDGFEDANGNVLSTSQIRRIVRENKKLQKNHT
jgi:hypothetical protein